MVSYKILKIKVGRKRVEDEKERQNKDSKNKTGTDIVDIDLLNCCELKMFEV
jgi:hypothetical protein